MAVVKLERFCDPHFLRGLGRPLLTEFIERFRPELERRNLILPLPRALTEEFYNVVAHLVTAPEGLPPAMREALHAIQEMGTPEGQQQIELLASRTGSELGLGEEDCTCAELATRVWLRAPELLARARDLHRVARLCTFHHFGCKGEVAAPLPPSLPGPEALKRIESACDQWFSRHNRGRHNTAIDFYDLPGGLSGDGGREWWFLVSHGEALTRTAKVERGLTEMLHFRPARVDVVVFNFLRNELRINARTVGELNLYRCVFGEALLADANSFSERMTYTLDPLRTEGADALDTTGSPEIARAVLKGFELVTPGACGVKKTYKSADIFAVPPHELGSCGVPETGQLVQAWMDLYFEGCPTPRPIQLRPPNTLRLSRYADGQAVENWLARQRFRVSRLQAAR